MQSFLDFRSITSCTSSAQKHRMPVSIVSNKCQCTATPTFAAMRDRQLSQNSKSASHANIDKHVLCACLHNDTDLYHDPCNSLLG